MVRGIFLCSGGLDSVVAAWKVRGEYSRLIVLFFDYGQRALDGERAASKACASAIGAEFLVVSLPELRDISGSLINSEGEVKEVGDLKDTSEESEKWYVPFRNGLFLSYAISLADSFDGESEIVVGFKNEGKEPFPDATPAFVDAMNRVSRLGSEKKAKIVAPLIDLDKEDIVQLGEKLGVDFGKTMSCYVGPEKHCGKCLACSLRKAGFKWADVEDPTVYLEQ